MKLKTQMEMNSYYMMDTKQFHIYMHLQYTYIRMLYKKMNSNVIKHDRARSSEHLN